MVQVRIEGQGFISQDARKVWLYVLNKGKGAIELRLLKDDKQLEVIKAEVNKVMKEVMSEVKSSASDKEESSSYLNSIDGREIIDNVMKKAMELVKEKNSVLDSINEKTTIKVTTDEIYRIINPEEEVEIIEDESNNTIELSEDEELDEDIELEYEDEEEEYQKNKLKEEAVENVLKELMNYRMKVYEGDNMCIINPISSIYMLGEIEIELNPKFMQYFIKDVYNKRFCIGENVFFDIKNIYAVRILDTILRKLSSGKYNVEDNTDVNQFKLEITPSELRKEFCISGSHYERYADLKRRILIPSIKEIKKAGYDIDLVEKKEGRKVTSIQFEVKMNM